MRVLQVIPSISPARGGPSAVVRTISSGLAAAGAEVSVVTTDDDGPTRRAAPGPRRGFLDAGVTYRVFPRQVPFYTVSAPLARWLHRHVRDFDVVHLHGLFTFPTSAGACSARHGGVPYVVRPLGTLEPWGLATRRPALKRVSLAVLERRVLGTAAALQWTTSAEHVRAPAGARARPGVVIANPVEIPTDPASRGAFTAGTPQLDGRPYVLFLSRLDPKKGLELLLDAFGLLRPHHPRLALVVAGAAAGAGGPAYRERLARQARALGVAGDVVWAGALYGPAKWAALRDARALVLASHSENFGMCVAEAMGVGTPVVISDQVGIHPDVTASGAGLVVPRVAPAIAAAIATILASPELATRMGEAGRSLVSSTYSPAVVTAQLVSLYEGLRTPRSGTHGHP